MKRRGKYEKKAKFRLPLSAYLTYLLVATLMFTSVSFSKYATTASGSDSARVACWVADITGNEKSGNRTLDGVGEGMSGGQNNLDSFLYEVTVTNVKDDLVCEVSMDYTIYVELDEGVPKDLVDITVDDRLADEITTDESTNGTLLAFKMGNILKAGEAASYTHTVSVAQNYYTNASYEQFGFCIYAVAEQIN